MVISQIEPFRHNRRTVKELFIFKAAIKESIFCKRYKRGGFLAKFANDHFVVSLLRVYKSKKLVNIDFSKKFILNFVFLTDEILIVL